MNRAIPSIGALALAWPTVASACPDCDVSRATRTAIFNDPSSPAYIVLTALPIALIVLAAVVAYRVGSPSVSSRPTGGGDR